MNDEEKKSGWQIASENSGYAVVLIVLALYVFYGMVDISDINKTIADIIIAGFLAWVLGFTINRILERQGIIHGNNNSKVITAHREHQKAVDEINPFIEYGDAWCEDENAEALKSKRISKLGGLKYENYFDTDGSIKDSFPSLPKTKFWAFMWFHADHTVWLRNKQKNRHIKEAIKAKIKPLSMSALTTSSNGSSYDPYNFGKTIDQYIASSSTKDVVSKIVTGIIFGYYGVKLLTDFDYAYLYWTGIQAGTFLISGFQKELSSMFYITENLKNITYRKIDLLKKFKNCDKTKYKKVEVKQSEVQGHS